MLLPPRLGFALLIDFLIFNFSMKASMKCNVDVRLVAPRLGFSYTSLAASYATDQTQEEPLQAVGGRPILQQAWPAQAPPPPPPPPPCSTHPWRCSSPPR